MLGFIFQVFNYLGVDLKIPIYHELGNTQVGITKQGRSQKVPLLCSGYYKHGAEYVELNQISFGMYSRICILLFILNQRFVTVN